MNKLSLIACICLIGFLKTSAQDWVKVLDDPQSRSANQVLRLPNGDLMIAGQVNDPGEYFLKSGLLARTTPDGELIWQKRYGSTTPDGAYYRNEHFKGLALSSDGYIIAVGTRTPNQADAYSISDVMVAKIDLDGNEIWRKYFDGGLTDNGFGICALSNGEMVVCGNTSSYSPTGNLDGFLMKLDAEGTQQWLKTYGDPNVEDWLYKVILTSDQELLTVGTTQLSGVGNRTLAVKADIAGNSLWEKTYPEYAIKGSSVTETPNGNFGICGMGYGSSTSFDNLVMEIDTKGAIVWGEHYYSPGPLPVPDELFDIVPCSEGGYAAVGLSGTDPFDGFHLLRVDAQGNTLGMSTLFDGAPNTEYATSLTWAGGGSLIVTGGRLKPSGDYDLLITHLSGFGCSAPSATGVTDLPPFELRVWPNPASDFVQFDVQSNTEGPYLLQIFDAQGKALATISSSAASMQVPCGAYPSGVYFYSIQSADGRAHTGNWSVHH